MGCLIFPKQSTSLYVHKLTDTKLMIEISGTDEKLATDGYDHPGDAPQIMAVGTELSVPHSQFKL